MFGFGKKRSASRLKALLADYSAWAPPHLGHVLKLPDITGPVLTPEQARENFLAYREAVPSRIATLRPALAELGVDLDQAYADATGFVRRLHPMLLTELAPLYRPELATRDAWELSNRAGDGIVLTFLADHAMLTGDALIRANPGVFWGQNLQRGDRLTFTYRRPCLIGLGDRLFPNLPPSVFFLEGEWFSYYANFDRPDRLAPADFVIGGVSPVIGQALTDKLERYGTHPDIARLRAEGWMKDAA